MEVVHNIKEISFSTVRDATEEFFRPVTKAIRWVRDFLSVPMIISRESERLVDLSITQKHMLLAVRELEVEVSRMAVEMQLISMQMVNLNVETHGKPTSIFGGASELEFEQTELSDPSSIYPFFLRRHRTVHGELAQHPPSAPVPPSWQEYSRRAEELNSLVLRIKQEIFAKQIRVYVPETTTYLLLGVIHRLDSLLKNTEEVLQLEPGDTAEIQRGKQAYLAATRHAVLETYKQLDNLLARIVDGLATPPTEEIDFLRERILALEPLVEFPMR